MSNKKEVLFLREEYGEGRGKYTYPHGDKYEGEWKNGLPNGKGVFTFGKGKWEGDKYIREHKEGEKHGQWTLTSPDGDMYEGEFKDGKYDGQGTYTWSDGREYVGEWLDGETKRSWYCHVKGWEVCRRMEG